MSEQGKLEAGIDWFSGILCLLVGFIFPGIAVFLMWQSGLFKFSELSDGKTIAAVMGLFGALFTSMTTTLGYILKHSIDTKNLILKEEAEKRLKTQTVISAVDLMDLPAEKDSPNTKLEGALFACANLGEINFVISILFKLWPNKIISDLIAVKLIDMALNSNDRKCQEEAAVLLGENYKRLMPSNDLWLFPDCVNGRWKPDLPELAKASIFLALIKSNLIVPRSKARRGSLHSAFLYNLYLICKNDSHTHYKVAAAGCIKKLIIYQ